MKMEQTVPKRRHIKFVRPGNYPEESIQHSEHGESMKSRRESWFCHMFLRTRRCSCFDCSGFVLLLCFFLNFHGPIPVIFHGHETCVILKEEQRLHLV